MNERPSPEIKLERESPSKGSSYKKEASAVVSQASSGQAVGRGAPFRDVFHSLATCLAMKWKNAPDGRPTFFKDS